jgi:hypothetical protein
MTIKKDDKPEPYHKPELHLEPEKPGPEKPAEKRVGTRGDLEPPVKPPLRERYDWGLPHEGDVARVNDLVHQLQQLTDGGSLAAVQTALDNQIAKVARDLVAAAEAEKVAAAEKAAAEKAAEKKAAAPVHA